MPKAGDILLDTNAVIAFLDDDQSVINAIGERAAFIPFPVVGELYFGVYKSARVKQNLATVHRVLAEFPVLFCDRESLEVYGRTKHELKRKGRMIPENDIWIAAVAIASQLEIVSRDDHFSNINNLRVVRW